MKPLTASIALAMVCIGLASCGENEQTTANESAAREDSAARVETETAGTGAGTASFPAGSRIVVENGVTFRVDPNGTRVRIGEDGAEISVGDDVNANVEIGPTPSVEVTTNTQ